MRVVVNLDTFGRTGQVKGLCQSFQQFTLSGAFRHFSSEAFFGVTHGGNNKFAFFTLLRNKQINLSAQLFAEQILHQICIFDVMGQDNLACGFFSCVKLSKKSFEHLFMGHIPAHSWIKITIAPILMRPDEKHLHTGLTRVEVKGDYIRFAYRSGIDALGRLDLCQCTNAVTNGSRSFKFHTFGSLCHVFGKLFLNFSGFT